MKLERGDTGEATASEAPLAVKMEVDDCPAAAPRIVETALRSDGSEAVLAIPRAFIPPGDITLHVRAFNANTLLFFRSDEHGIEPITYGELKSVYVIPGDPSNGTEDMETHLVPDCSKAVKP